jgi:hypothetical protein
MMRPFLASLAGVGLAILLIQSGRSLVANGCLLRLGDRHRASRPLRHADVEAQRDDQ